MSATTLVSDLVGRIACVAVALGLSACATLTDDDEADPRERSVLATELLVTRQDNGREVVENVPPESVMERFDMVNADGRRIAYVAFTDTETGGLVFLDNTLLGSISREDAQAFFSCRGYATANGRPWGADASQWSRSLLERVQPTMSIHLQFSGKSVVQSLKDLTGNAMVGQLRSLLDMGTNPLNVVKTASRLRSDYRDRKRYETVLRGLRSVTPGQGEGAVAAVARPEDVAFVPGGLVMSYQRFLIEFYLVGGIVQVIQQPSLHQLSRTYGGLFYLANTNWQACTPEHWPSAVTALEHQRVPAYAPSFSPSGKR